MTIRAAVLTVSDKCARGERVDTAGPTVAEILRDTGADVVTTEVVADEREDIAGRLRSWADSGAIDLILTMGGTGLALREVTARSDPGRCRTSGTGIARSCERPAAGAPTSRRFHARSPLPGAERSSSICPAANVAPTKASRPSSTSCPTPWTCYGATRASTTPSTAHRRHTKGTTRTSSLRRSGQTSIGNTWLEDLYGPSHIDRHEEGGVVNAPPFQPLLRIYACGGLESSMKIW